MSRAFQLFQFQFDFCEVVMFRNSSTINYNYLIINKLYMKQLKLKRLAELSFI